MNQQEKINEMVMKKLEEELAYIGDDIKVLAEGTVDDYPKVYEDDFIKYMLPYMLNLVEKQEENNTAFINNWVNLVGDLLTDFYVVNESGDILFRVPKYLTDYDNVNTPISDVSYITILKEFDMEQERAPEKAEADLNKTMDILSSMVQADKNSLREFYDLYILLRKRYNDYYLGYKCNFYNSVLDNIKNEIQKLNDDLYNMDPDDDSTEIENRIIELNKEKSNIIDKLDELGCSGIETKHQLNNDSNDIYLEENDFDYGDVDYDD